MDGTTELTSSAFTNQSGGEMMLMTASSVLFHVLHSLQRTHEEESKARLAKEMEEQGPPAIVERW